MDSGIFIRCLTSVFFYDGNGVDGVYKVGDGSAPHPELCSKLGWICLFDGDDLRIVRWTFHSCFDRKYLMLD